MCVRGTLCAINSGDSDGGGGVVVAGICVGDRGVLVVSMMWSW